MARDGAVDDKITGHYSDGGLLARLTAALLEDGVDPEHPTIDGLAPYDQFHGRGLEATHEMAAMLSLLKSDRVLDIGSGIGGPARYVARRYGCHVTGIDLTPEFCDVARHLTAQLGLDDSVCFEQGNALAMPFADQTFDAAYSMNVSMNIADKAGFYGEIFRVLKPGARLVLSEVAKGPGPDLTYPTPWAMSAGESFLATPDETRDALKAAGFVIVALRDMTDESLAYGARSRDMVERGEKPPHRAVQLVHGDLAATALKNSSRGVAEGGSVPIEVLCRKRD